MQIANQTMGRQPGRGNPNGYQPQRNAGTHGRSAKVNVHSSSNVFLATPGQVRQDLLTDHNWPRQLAELLDAYGRTRKKCFKAKSSETTLENRRNILHSTFRMIMNDKGFTSLSQIKPRHIPRIIEMWRASGVGIRAMRNYYWHLGWFFKLCGMNAPAIGEFASYPGEFVTSRAATRDLSWKGNGVDFDAVYQVIRADDPVAARLMLAIKTFGLRVKESVCLNPHEADRIHGLAITKGSKTGRARMLEFEHFGERDFRKVLDEIKSEVPPDVHLAWSHRTLKQAMSHVYWLMRKHGVTRSKLGVTLHGLRHDFAIDMLEELTGATAPIRGGLVINYRAISDARLKVSNALGHVRLEITTSYYGTFISLEREQMRRFTRSWQRLESCLQGVLDLLDDHGVENLYWIGKRSVGSDRTEEPFELVLPPGVEPQMAIDLSRKISEVVVGGTGCDCSVRAWESMSGSQQLLYQSEAVPLFSAAKSPLQVMEERLAEHQKIRREAGKKPESLHPDA